MKLFNWSGAPGEVLSGSAAASGTGQSGGLALTTTAAEVLTGASALDFTQQTSSGTGTSANYWIMTLPLGSNIIRFNVVFNLKTADADVLYWLLTMTDYDGTNISSPGLRLNSNYGATEQVEYLNSSDAWTDSGLTYPADLASLYNLFLPMGFDYDRVNHNYLRMWIGEETLLSTISVKSSASSVVAHNNFGVSLAGDDTASECIVDSISLEDIT